MYYIKLLKMLLNSYVKCIDVVEWKMLFVLKMIFFFFFDVGIGKILELMWCFIFWGYIVYCFFFGSILLKLVKVYEYSVILNFN